MSRRVARLIPFYEFDGDEFFRADGAPPDIAGQRQDGFFAARETLRRRFAKGRQLTAEAASRVSDLQFTRAYRVPFQFRRLVREHLGTGSFMRVLGGVTVTDLDGNVFYDLTGSYGVNIFGNDFYKECIDGGASARAALGPVLGAYHPVVADNVAALCEISGLDEVSFHMSGTEAVMQAVRLARYHTRRTHLVRFAGAYHGWWGDVQPGVGNPVSPHETYTLAEMSEKTLHVLRTRRDIACVLVNPLQALHPERQRARRFRAGRQFARRAHFDRAAYTAWLKALRDGLHRARHRPDFRRGVSRLSPRRRRRAGIFRRARRHGDLRQDPRRRTPDWGGLRQKDLMRRFRDDRPADVCFARGTFNSHPYVMTAMDEFLARLSSPNCRSIYRWPGRNLERPRRGAQRAA